MILLLELKLLYNTVRWKTSTNFGTDFTVEIQQGRHELYNILEINDNLIIVHRITFITTKTMQRKWEELHQEVFKPTVHILKQYCSNIPCSYTREIHSTKATDTVGDRLQQSSPKTVQFPCLRSQGTGENAIKFNYSNQQNILLTHTKLTQTHINICSI